MSHTKHSARSFYKLVSTYWEIGVIRTCHRSKLEGFGKIIIAFNYFRKYARILNVSDPVNSIKSMYYWTVILTKAHSVHWQTFKMECLAEQILSVMRIMRAAEYASISLSIPKCPWKCSNKPFGLCQGSWYTWSFHMAYRLLKMPRVWSMPC